MAHLFVNHHFFYGPNGRGQVLRGPSRDLLDRQLTALRTVARPASGARENLDGGDFVFSITIDDGSRSVLDVLDVFQEHGVHVCLCVSGAGVLDGRVLLAHKIALLRLALGDTELTRRLREQVPDFETRALQAPALRLEDLYRYDEGETRQLKLGLNYRLSPEEAQAFVDPLFEGAYGSEAEVAREIYLSLDDLRALPDEVELGFHGLEHRLWASLEGDAHRRELTPPTPLRSLLGERYALAIPFGISGTHRAESILADRGDADAAFTMERRLLPERDAESGFWWLHRFDQADLFDRTGALREDPRSRQHGRP